MYSCLFDNRAPDGHGLLFRDPIEIIRADTPAEVENALTQLEGAWKSGLYAAGFFSFELGYLFEPRLIKLMPSERNLPLLMFGLFEEAQSLTKEEVDVFIGKGVDSYKLNSLHQSITRDEYSCKFQKTLDYIIAGDIYQLNLTFKAGFEFNGNRRALYRHLRQKQRVRYGCLIESEDFTILSLSPELFLRIDGPHILTRPMKGTAPRGLSAQSDSEARAWLAADVKSRAENLMIVDLMRNDLTRIATMGSVRITDLFSVETFETLHQMTSGVEAELAPDAGLKEILHALFPAGSVTGAPKIRAMEILNAIEDEPRGVYTGALGYLCPKGGAQFSVAIRTAVINAEGRGEIGIGSGIVADSNADAEFDECLLKLRFLTDPPLPQFELIETLLWEPEPGYILLERHLARLLESASYFEFELDEGGVKNALYRYAQTLSGGEHRVRLTASRQGGISITSVPLQETAAGLNFRFAIAEERVSSSNLFLYHKTTERAFFDRMRKAYRERTGCDEVVFLNERDELTEGSFTTLFAEIDGRFLTPPLSCGLLPGTLRAELLATGRAKEAILTVADLTRASGIYLGNSVRGLVPARLILAAKIAPLTSGAPRTR